ncbi:hypothetical protein BC830DRAFT_1158485 [Chytriomyces sp. MP71]|nr:hypothetical protein BC830DRAFT_1158485 [Chytriomyces sp. MP71]
MLPLIAAVFCLAIQTAVASSFSPSWTTESIESLAQTPLDKTVTESAVAPRTHWFWTENLGYWTLDPVPTAELHTVIRPANANNTHAGVPSTLYGIWWFKNTQPTGLVSLAGMQHLEGSDGIYVMPSYTDQYSYDNTREGILNWKSSFYEDFDFKMKFQTPDVMVVEPLFYNIKSPSFIQNFTMEFVKEGHWRRKSKIFGLDINEGDYDVLRVADGEGNVNQVVLDAFIAQNKARAGTDYSLLGHERTHSEWVNKNKRDEL